MTLDQILKLIQAAGSLMVLFGVVLIYRNSVNLLKKTEQRRKDSRPDAVDPEREWEEKNQ